MISKIFKLQNNPDQVRKLLRIFKDLKRAHGEVLPDGSKPTQDKVLAYLKDMANCGPESKNLNAARKFEEVWLECFDKLIKSSGRAVKKEMRKAIESPASEDGIKEPTQPPQPQGATPDFPFDMAFAHWIRGRDLDLKGFADACAGNNGHYLLIRMPRPKTLIVSEMTIEINLRKSPLPMFETVRYSKGGKDKVVVGTIFKSSHGVYALGRRPYDDLLRTSSLHYVPRPNRVDLYGMRTGINPANNRYYSHLVYCYQVKSKPRKQQVMALRQSVLENRYEEVKAMNLKGFNKIIDYLTPEQSGGSDFSYGMQPKPIT